MIRIHGIKLNLNEDQHRLQNAAARKLHVSADDIEIVRIARMSLDAREKPVVYRVFSLDIKSRRSDDWLIKACRKSGLQYSDEKTERFEIRPLQKFENDSDRQDPAKNVDFSIKNAANPRCTSLAADPFSLKRPIIVGFGPCGMFAALALAEYGLRPLVLERGGCMEERIATVEAFWNSGKLDPECNVQFGEGGAGTFSDGKLTTGTRSPYSQWILEQFVESGASPEILYLQKPHIGTDVLRKVVVNIRKKIEALGGEVLFNCKMESLLIEESRICGVNATRTVPGNSILNEEISNSHSSARPEAFSIQTDTVILAFGHSARDTIRSLYDQGLIMEQKPFSMGVRIEHPQALIDMTQYGALHEDLGIGAADYKLNVKTAGGRGVYTFCMCPGGYVINSSSAPGMLTTNGMSNSGRDSGIANSALLADVLPSDYASEYLPEEVDPSHPLAGIAFQEKYERLAFELGGGDYCAPAQTVGEFLSETQPNNSIGNTPDPGTSDMADQTATGSDTLNQLNSGIPDSDLSNHLYSGIKVPSFRPGTHKTDLHKCLPDFVADALTEALPLLGKKLHGFDSPDAVMTAIESRSSSPVRIKRDSETLQSHINGLYPAGVGAGYAGGIMSAAADGVRIAVKLAENISQ